VPEFGTEESNPGSDHGIFFAMRKISPAILLALLPPLLAGAEEISFESHGIRLAGSVVLPDTGDIHAAIVFVHGSGKQSRNITLAEKFAAAGIAALVYDKRGAGQSGGVYESEQSVSGMNISLLADDAAAAVNALAARPELKGIPIGIAGISQAGWIAPLAAERTPAAKFLVLWSGPVCKVSEEDIYSKYTADKDLAQVPPYREALEARTTPYIWPDFLGIDTDPADSLAKLSIPGFWIFGGNDGSVPVDLSITRLQALQRAAAGTRYEYRLFPSLGHNNMDDTFAAAVDWIRKVRSVGAH
jgi:pimeloyl-ACP methyl ester carboxylesterase